MRAIPVLHVGNSRAAENFYCNLLGFTLQFAYRPSHDDIDPAYLGVVRDGAELHLSSFPGDGVVGSAVYVFVEDVDALHAELAATGASIDTPPVDQTWGTREMFMRDPDGNRIQFGQRMQAAPSGNR